MTWGTRTRGLKSTSTIRRCFIDRRSRWWTSPCLDVTVIARRRAVLVSLSVTVRTSVNGLIQIVDGVQKGTGFFLAIQGVDFIGTFQVAVSVLVVFVSGWLLVRWTWSVVAVRVSVGIKTFTLVDFGQRFFDSVLNSIFKDDTKCLLNFITLSSGKH